MKKKASAKDGFIWEPSREIPVVASYDVLVAGGGPSGVAAALAVNSRDCVRDINIPILQETLRRQGALLEI